MESKVGWVSFKKDCGYNTNGKCWLKRDDRCRLAKNCPKYNDFIKELERLGVK